MILAGQYQDVAIEQGKGTDVLNYGIVDDGFTITRDMMTSGKIIKHWCIIEI